MSVGVVTVNWNTRGLLARLVFGLRRVLPPGDVGEIVVVDNASDDGSVELARALEAAGVVRLIANDENRYHGLGLTQGVDALLESGDIDLVWALDTDVLVLRKDAVRAAAQSLREHNAVLAADLDDYAPEPPHVTTERLSACSILFDPAVVWRAPHSRFRHDGEPSRQLQADLVAHGHRLLAFPFCARGYILHLGRATLAEVRRRGDVDNEFSDWAATHHEPHYGLRPDGSQLASEFERAYRAAVPDDDPATLVTALSRSEL